MFHSFLQWTVVQLMLSYGLLHASQELALKDSYYGLPVLYPYGNCSKKLESQTLTLYLTNILPDSYKMYAAVMRRKDASPVEQPSFAYPVTNLTTIPVLLTNERATSYSQCMNFYCDEPSNNHTSCAMSNRINGMSMTISPRYLSVMSSAVYQEPFFVQVVPLMPLVDSEERVYTYYILYGDSLPKSAFSVPSIGLMSVYTSDINVTLEGTQRYNKNGEMLSMIKRRKLSLQKWDVMWIQSSLEEVRSRATKLTSTQPLLVYKGLAKKNTTDFSYINIHIHQIPDSGQWGTVFVADLSHTQMLPQQNVIVSFKLLATNSSIVTVTMYPVKSSQVLQLEAEKTVTLTLKDRPSLIAMQSTEKILVLYEVYTSTPEGNLTIFSILLQPVEWYTYKQAALLVSALETSTLPQYSIAVVTVRDAVVSVQNSTSTPVVISEYKHFESIKSTVVSEYTVYRIAVKPSMPENYTLVFTARDLSGCQQRLGASLFCYSPNTSYAHTNPPVIDDSIIQSISDECKKPVDHSTETVIGSTTGATVLLLIALITITVVVVMVTKPRTIFGKPDPPPQGFGYDIFLSFADGDRDVVQSLLYSPLRKKGYEVFWHLSDFIAGLTIAENMLTAIKRSRWIIFVCSKHFEESEFCQQELRFGLGSHYCAYKGRYRRVIPLVLDKGPCPGTLRQLYPIKLTAEQCRPTRKHTEALIRRLHLGRPLSEMTERRVKEDTAGLLNDV